MQRYSALTLVVFIILGFLFKTNVRAGYVLPYPSYMPGNKFYRISLIFDKLEVFWYFGSIASTKYHLKLADKYLVEAKTLFEYNQYLLAVDALKRSDDQFKLVPIFLSKASHENKDVSNLNKLVIEASAKHVSVLTALKSGLPETFNWTPEKTKPIELNLWRVLDDSISVRQVII